MKLNFTLTLLGVCLCLGSFAQPRTVNRPVALRSVELINARAINSEQLDFSPTFYQNGIVYVTSRHKQGAVDEKIQETFFELYYAELDAAGNPMRPQRFSTVLNSRAHEGPVTFNRNQDRMYFTRNNLKDGIRRADNKGVTRLKIYEARRGRYDWERVQEMPFGSDKYSVCHPALSADGQRLFFASDMPGGYGGYDLYFAERTEDGTWSDPINLGADVNTSRNEGFPFAHKNGNLFFSSDGHPGAGGLDIFRIDIADNEWGRVENLGAPFNSAADDLGFILDRDGTRGFLTSNRGGGTGKDDIYLFQAPDGLGPELQQLTVPRQLLLTDAVTERGIAGAEVRLFERDQNGFIVGNNYYDTELVPQANGAAGEYVFKLKPRDPSDLGPPTGRTDANGRLLMNLPAGQRFLFLVHREGYEPAELNHRTDDGSTGLSSLELSLKVEETCIPLAGILREGEQRLTQHKVTARNLETGEEFEELTNEQGQFALCLPKNANYQLRAVDGHRPPLVRQFDTRSVPEMMDVDLLAGRTPSERTFGSEALREGAVIVLENIYYDFNKSAIRASDARELDALVQLMRQHPSMRIELSAHTDARGKADYNLTLSQQRAESARNYLIGKGIAGYRIEALGYGESQLRNGCRSDGDCTEEQHAENRRTEVKILEMGAAQSQMADDPFGQ